MLGLGWGLVPVRVLAWVPWVALDPLRPRGMQGVVAGQAEARGRGPGHGAHDSVGCGGRRGPPAGRLATSRVLGPTGALCVFWSPGAPRALRRRPPDTV